MDDFPTALAAAGACAVLIAAIAWLGDRRRMRRSDPDKVGFMPWTELFFWALFASFVLIGLAAKAWIAG